MHPLPTIFLACCALSGISAQAQRMEPRLASASLAARELSADSITVPRLKAPRTLLGIPRRDSSWWVPLASTVLPGAGQALLGQSRFVAYFAVEGYILVDYLNQASIETRERARSRALAHDVSVRR